MSMDRDEARYEDKTKEYEYDLVIKGKVTIRAFDGDDAADQAESIRDHLLYEAGKLGWGGPANVGINSLDLE